MFNNLSAEQKRKNLTNQNVADYLQISRVTYERKKRMGNFTVSQANKLCELFGCTYEYLFATDKTA